MKNRKGFTLVELLVVIVIIGIVGSLAWPTINMLVENGDISKIKTYGDSMVAAAKVYTDSYEDDLFSKDDDLSENEMNTGQCAYIFLNQLIEHSYIKDYNYDDMTCLSNHSFVVVEKKGDNYTYTPFMGCGKKEAVEADGTLPEGKITMVYPEREDGSFHKADTDACSHTTDMYTLTYEGDGADQCTPSQKTIIFVKGRENSWGQLCKPALSGQYFTGWVDSNGKPVTASTIATSNLTVTSTWRKSKVQLVYKTDGGVWLDDHGADLTESNGTILLSGSELVRDYNYDDDLEYHGLSDYNNPNYINIGLKGYHAIDFAEWQIVRIEKHDQSTGTWYDIQSDDPDYAKLHKGFNQWGSYPMKEFCDYPEGDCRVSLAPNWDYAHPNTIYLRQHSNGNVLVQNQHGENVSIDAAGYFTYNGSNILEKIQYGGLINEDGVWNWNSRNWINIALKDGQRVETDKEWVNEAGLYVDQNKQYSYDELKQFVDSARCITQSDAAHTETCKYGCNPDYSDCNLTVKFNWRQNYSNIVFYLDKDTEIVKKPDAYVEVSLDENNRYLYNKNNEKDGISTNRAAYGGSVNLANYNNSNFLYLRKENYIAEGGKEYISESGVTYGHGPDYSSSDFCDSRVDNCTVNVRVNWVKVPVRWRYHVNGGTLNTTNTHIGVDSNGFVTYDSNILTSSKSHDQCTGGDGLSNYNNGSYLKVNRPAGKSNPPSGQEWAIKDENGNVIKTFSQAGAICNDDLWPYCKGVYNTTCDITLYVNWQ